MKTIKPKLVIFDFDGVMYRHTKSCPSRMIRVASLVSADYTGMDVEETDKRCRESWSKHRDAFRFIREDLHNDNIYYDAHYAFARVVRDDVHGEKFENIPTRVLELGKRLDKGVCIMSHSMTPTLKMMMNRMGFSFVLTEKHAYGLDVLGGEGVWARKDDPNSGVYEWICDKYDVQPQEALMVEDTELNLICAKDAGLQTAFVHWNERRFGQHIDFSSPTTSNLLDHLLQQTVVRGLQPAV